MLKDTGIFRVLEEKLASGVAVALVTVISAEGSTPREAGAKMLVCGDGSWSGTVGGGKLEHLAMAEAKKALSEGCSRKVAFELTEKGIGMVCNGSAEVFIEVYNRGMRVFIAGAGHVGQKLGAACGALGIPYDVADDRDEFANRERFPGAANIYVQPADKAITPKNVSVDTCVVIVTRGHALDQESLEAALATKACYIGMIGSKNKVATVYANVRKKRLWKKPQGRVYSPIGLALGGKTPSEIAVSILAEIVKLRNGGSAAHMRI